jgi:hypothetical protein
MNIEKFIEELRELSIKHGICIRPDVEGTFLHSIDNREDIGELSIGFFSGEYEVLDID